MQKRCESLYYKGNQCKKKNLMEKICLIFTARVSIAYDEIRLNQKVLNTV